jgi:hypothetical protein
MEQKDRKRRGKAGHRTILAIKNEMEIYGKKAF